MTWLPLAVRSRWAAPLAALVLASALGCPAPAPDGGDGNENGDEADADAGPEPVPDGGDGADGGASAPDAGATDDDAGVDAGPPVDPAVWFLLDPRPHDPDFAPVPGTLANYSDPFYVVAEGLPPGETVRLDAESADYASWATFIIGPHGTLDLREDAPTSGTWSEADADGLIWSMAPTGEQNPLDLTVHVSLSAGGEVLAEASLGRRFVNEGVVTEPVAEGTVVGSLVFPEGEGPFPGVMVFGGSEGGISEFAAWQIAQLGFAAFGTGYFGAAGLPAELREIPLEQLEENLAYFAADPRVDADHIAVLGGSRGGELALLLGAHLPIVKAVIADVPSGVVWGSVSAPIGPAWTFEGEPLPYVPSAFEAPETEYDDDGFAHISSTNTFLASLAEASNLEVNAAKIPIENLEGPVFLFAGADDALWPSCTLADFAWERLENADHVEVWGDVYFCAEGAGHNIGRPGWSTLFNTEYWNASWNAYTVMGGTPAGIGAAQRARDTELRRFLEDALDYVPPPPPVD